MTPFRGSVLLIYGLHGRSSAISASLRKGVLVESASPRGEAGDISQLEGRALMVF